MSAFIERNIRRLYDFSVQPIRSTVHDQKTRRIYTLKFERLAIFVTTASVLFLGVLNFFVEEFGTGVWSRRLVQGIIIVAISSFFYFVKPGKLRLFPLFYSSFYLAVYAAISLLPEISVLGMPVPAVQQIFLIQILIIIVQGLRPGILSGLPAILFLFMHAIVIVFTDPAFVWNFTQLLRLFLFIWTGIIVLFIEIVLHHNMTKYLELNLRQRQQQIELGLAQKVHDNLFPDFKESEKIKIISYLSPENKTGGDFYDVIHLREGNIGFFLTDISGHGISSAMMSASLKVILHQVPYYYRIKPELMLAHLDTTMQKAFNSHHASAVYMFLDFHNMLTRIGNAGHPPLLVQTGRGKFQTLQTTGGIIGYGLAKPPAREISFSLHHGDRFIIYTDGLFEYATPDESIPDIEPEKMFDGLEYYKSEEIIEHLLDTIRKRPDFRHFRDDVLILILEVK